MSRQARVDRGPVLRMIDGAVDVFAAASACVFFSFFVIFGSCTPAAAASFSGLGDLPTGAYDSVANAISADGTTVVGTGTIFVEGWHEGVKRAFRSRNGVMEPLSCPTVPTQIGNVPSDYCAGFAVSATGDVVGGERRVIVLTNSEVTGWGWDANGDGLILIDGEGYLLTHVADVSSSGEVALGTGERSDTGDGETLLFDRVAQSKTLIPMPDSPTDYGSAPVAMAADASVVVANRGSFAFRWSGGVSTWLDVPPGAWNGVAHGLSADGQVTVGQAGSAAVRWLGTSVEVLGSWPGATSTRAIDASADGSVIVATAFMPTGHIALVWDEANGLRTLRSVLEAAGVSAGSWQLTDAGAISDDGTRIAGTGINPDGDREAFVAEVDVAAIALPGLGWVGAAMLASLLGVVGGVRVGMRGRAGRLG